VHTSLATAWQQMDLTRWRFTLRAGVNFAGEEDFDAPNTSHLCDLAMLFHVCFRASF
jgi:MarR-like DNA-binding transcriptional regulator SgrR of sgrS sRNA